MSPRRRVGDDGGPGRNRAARSNTATSRMKDLACGRYGSGRLRCATGCGGGGEVTGRQRPPLGVGAGDRQPELASRPPGGRDTTATRPPPGPPGTTRTSPGRMRPRAPPPPRPGRRAAAGPPRGPRSPPAGTRLDVPQLAGGPRPPLGGRRQRPFELRLEAHHVGVGPVLGERQVEQVVRLVGRVPPDQVGRHVVGRPERGGQRVGPRGRQPGHLVERHVRRPQHDREARCRRSPAARPAPSAACTRPGGGTRGAHR